MARDNANAPVLGFHPSEPCIPDEER